MKGSVFQKLMFENKNALINQLWESTETESAQYLVEAMKQKGAMGTSSEDAGDMVRDELEYA